MLVNDARGRPRRKAIAGGSIKPPRTNTKQNMGRLARNTATRVKESKTVAVLQKEGKQILKELARGASGKRGGFSARLRDATTGQKNNEEKPTNGGGSSSRITNAMNKVKGKMAEAADTVRSLKTAAKETAELNVKLAKEIINDRKIKKKSDLPSPRPPPASLRPGHRTWAYAE